ncbi:hypothetical protein Lalb_Chr00c35g0408631 [Lupinus albus]|uniref:Uncharacterized protein n=1 Tax=Lupinus albus TaxID=3870 RepID=A0A6A4N546_LUPAL|nr:hypothetical protein Lalb_Chr00c35g0408631 [Lupinus albus]
MLDLLKLMLTILCMLSYCLAHCFLIVTFGSLSGLLCVLISGFLCVMCSLCMGSCYWMSSVPDAVFCWLD